jgi:hypothetical protein
MFVLDHGPARARERGHRPPLAGGELGRIREHEHAVAVSSTESFLCEGVVVA